MGAIIAYSQRAHGMWNQQAALSYLILLDANRIVVHHILGTKNLGLSTLLTCRIERMLEPNRIEDRLSAEGGARS